MIKDNLLDSTGLKEIEDTLHKMPWYISDKQMDMNHHSDCLVNVVYNLSKPNDLHVFNILTSYFSLPLDVVCWYRIRINLTYKQKEFNLFGWHNDYRSYNVPDHPQFQHMTTGLFYLNNTNGPTLFKDGEKVDCVKNRLLTFPSSRLHSGTHHTEGDNKRVVINFNYF